MPGSATPPELKTTPDRPESVTPPQSPKTSVLKRGSLGAEVVKIQTELKNLGYFNSEKYGYYGFLTEASVREFQRDRGLKADGIVGPKTRAALAAISPQQQPAPSPTTEPQETTGFKIDTSTQIPPLKIPSQPDTPNPTPQTLMKAIAFLQNPSFVEPPPRDPSGKMTHLKTITGGLSPKSIVHSGTGLFFAQNMMYRHTITIYDRTFELIKTIPDNIKLSDFGFSKFQGNYKGSPVEASFSPDGKFAYVANYKMYGSGFKRPGTDKCSPAGKHDDSFLYKINTETLTIEQAIQVGPVPKFNAVTPDGRFVLVSNWCGWDLSVVDTQTDTEIQRIKIGRYPRGIAVHPDSKTAYVAVMGSTQIARVNLEDFSVSWLNNVGRAPRHLNISPDGKFLYVTLNSEGKVAKLDLSTGKIIKKITTGKNPRSMAISDDGQFLYVVNYKSNTMSKVRTEDMKIIHSVRVNHHPIGITYDPQMRQVWVACYSGSVMVFQD
ncbi:MAG: peptidoglycan-binding protein [Limnospira sp.]